MLPTICGSFAVVVHSRLEATAPCGLMREAQIEEEVTPSGRMVSSSELAHFGMVSPGNCWLSVDGVPDAIPLMGGDCFLLAPRSYLFCGTLSARPRSFCEVASKTSSNLVHYGGGGAPTTIIPGLLSFDRVSLRPMTHLLPS